MPQLVLIPPQIIQYDTHLAKAAKLIVELKQIILQSKEYGSTMEA